MSNWPRRSFPRHDQRCHPKTIDVWDRPRTDMLTYGNNPKRAAFRAAIERAQEDGLSLDDLASMITAAAETQHPANGVHAMEPGDVIYEPGELPEGFDRPAQRQQKIRDSGANVTDVDQTRQATQMWARPGKGSWRRLHSHQGK